MKTLKVYFNEEKTAYQIVTPSEAFYKNVKGERINPDWTKLAYSLYPNYHSFDVY